MENTSLALHTAVAKRAPDVMPGIFSTNSSHDTSAFFTALNYNCVKSTTNLLSAHLKRPKLDPFLLLAQHSPELSYYIVSGRWAFEHVVAETFTLCFYDPRKG